MKYTKPPLPFAEQIKLLQSRGLVIKDFQEALHVLEHINYYRLSAYFVPFQLERDVFIEGATLANILNLYEFDRRLRNLLADGLARIEISAKTQIAHHLAMKYGAFCYVNPACFHFDGDDNKHFQWLDKVRENMDRSHEAFKKYFYRKYDEETNLPIWMVVELMSFGQVSQLYNGLKKQDRQDIGRGYFRIDQRLMGSWLHTIVYIRNLCAHHSRIWNRKLSIRPLVNKKDKDWNSVDNSKIFAVFLLIKKMMHFQDKWDEWSGKLLTLLGEFPRIDVSNMGFVENWRAILFDGKAPSKA